MRSLYADELSYCLTFKILIMNTFVISGILFVAFMGVIMSYEDYKEYDTIWALYCAFIVVITAYNSVNWVVNLSYIFC